MEDETKVEGAIIPPKDDIEDVETLKAQIAEKDAALAREAEARKQLTARAKKAEAEANALKGTANDSATHTNNPPSSEAIDERILRDKGMSEELMSELKALAKVRGKGLIETQADPIFVALLAQKEAEAKAEKAKLGASKGSGSARKEKNFNSAGMTDEEHRAMWKEKGVN